MPRRLLVLLVLLLPAAAWAGPPAAPSGAIKFDAVGDALRKYSKETNPKRRVEWLSRLAVTHDPRVGVALGEALEDPSEDVQAGAARQLVLHFSPYAWVPMRDDVEWIMTAETVWRQCGADLRRRAKQLPR
jgi:hypothetical protein